MNIRNYQPEDFEELLHMIQEFDEYNEENILSEAIKPFSKLKEGALKNEIEKYAQDKERIILIVEDEEKILGFAGGKINAHEHKVLDKEGYIEDIFIREGYRERHLGVQLFEKLVEEFKKRGATHLGIDAYSTNTKALEIYRHWGFIDKAVVLVKKI